MLFILLLVFFIICAGVISLFLYRRGKFEALDNKIIISLTTIGVVLPFMDVVETCMGFEHEGNAFFLWIIQMLGSQIGWVIFISFHVMWSLIAVFMGWKGRNEDGKEYRALLVFWDLILSFLIIYNAIALESWSLRACSEKLK